MKQANSKILSDLVTKLAKNKSKEFIMEELSRVDEKLSELYSDNNEAQEILMQELAYSTLPKFMNHSNNSKLAESMSASTVVSLGIPKNNSLTDSLLRSTLGCEQKLAKSYLEILDDSEKIEEAEKQQRIEEAKQRFAASNKFSDIYANSRPQLQKTFNYAYHQYHNFKSQNQPVVDNEHQSYLKTQLMYLDKPKSGKKVNEKQYYDKHVDTITKKIKEIGGMEDTVGSMEESLGKYELRNFKKRAVYAGWTGSGFSAENNPFKNAERNRQHGEVGSSWSQRSKAIRQALMTKLDIQQ